MNDRNPDPFEREMLPLLPKEFWPDNPFTVFGAYHTNTKYGARTALEVRLLRDTEWAPAGTEAAILLHPTIVRDKMVAYFERGGATVSPVILQLNERGTWIVQRTRLSDNQDAAGRAPSGNGAESGVEQPQSGDSAATGGRRVENRGGVANDGDSGASRARRGRSGARAMGRSE